MKVSVVIAVLVVLGVVAGGGYYFIHYRELRVEAVPAEREKPDAARAREEIGTYKDARHPSFPGSEKKE
jgi:flagellar basal body-associated protein FliL